MSKTMSQPTRPTVPVTHISWPLDFVFDHPEIAAQRRMTINRQWIFASRPQGMVGPANMPAPVTSKLLKAVADMQADPAFQESVRRTGGVPSLVHGEAFRNLALSDRQTWGDLIKRLGISALIREAMQAWSTQELSRVVHRHCGRPIGSFEVDMPIPTRSARSREMAGESIQQSAPSGKCRKEVKNVI